VQHYIVIGQLLSDLPKTFKVRASQAGFVNDIAIGFSAMSIGATLYAANVADFQIIGKFLPRLKLAYLQAGFFIREGLWK